MVVFLERKLGVSVFSSLFMWGRTSPDGSNLEWQSQRKNHFKMGFPFTGGLLPHRKFIWFEDLLFSFWFPLLIGNYSVFLRSFPLYFLPIFDWESFFSFSFLSFSFLSLPFFDLWLGIWVLAFIIRSPLRRFCCPFLRGEGWGFSSWAKVQSSLRLCLNMVVSSCEPDFDIWGTTNSCVKVSVSGWTSISFPQGTRNNDDSETTCKN